MVDVGSNGRRRRHSSDPARGQEGHDPDATDAADVTGSPKGRLSSRDRLLLSRDRVAVAVAVLAPLAFCAALVPLRAHLSNTNVALVLVVLVVAVAANGNRLAGALAAIFAAVWFDFFFTVPYERFSITNSADIRTAVLLLLVGLAVSQLGARARRMRVIAVTDAGYLAQVHDTAVLAMSAQSVNDVVDQVREQLTELLHLRGCRFEYGSLLGHPPRIDKDGSVLWGNNRWDVERWGLPDEEIELRASVAERFYGRFMLQPTQGTVPSVEARIVAVTLASLAAAALDAAYSGQNHSG
jgi:hypothetical protein